MSSPAAPRAPISSTPALRVLGQYLLPMWPACCCSRCWSAARG
ncbi:hypothetical protein [Deinococcus sp.]|nr:hypothetical protein [Deinococcus sp.]